VRLLQHTCMPVPIVVVDAFTSTAFAGNPAAVCLLEAPADPRWMQAVADEMNLPMTAFVEQRGDGFNLRWFMPGHEEDLCGHATVATAHVPLRRCLPDRVPHRTTYRAAALGIDARPLARRLREAAA